MPHREDIRAFLENITVTGRVLDWGSGSKPVSKYVKNQGAKFTTIDKNVHVEPDILGDVQNPELDIVSSADFAFCMEVLEHTTDPLQVLKNIRMNLKYGGKLYLSVPFLYPEHGDEDYIRLTSRGLRYFASEAGFQDIEIHEITEGFIMEATK